jgi:hypothetical protein
MKTHIQFGILLFAFATVTGCGSDDGSSGVQGPSGANGNGGTDFPSTTFAGVVHNAGTPGSNFLVSLTSVAPNGTQGAVYGGSITDETGAFSITQTQLSEPSSRLRYEAYGEDRAFTALVTGLQQPIGPVTTAVEQIVSLIVGSDGAPVYADYTNAEIIGAVEDAQQAVATLGTNLQDDEAIFADILASTGEAIADLSGVDPVVQSASAPVTATPTDVQVPFVGDNGLVTLSNDLEWEVTPQGFMGSGAFSSQGVHLKTTDGESFNWQGGKSGGEVHI